MSKNEFYGGKSVVAVEWWLHDCDLPKLTWARLRLFDDGTADVCWEEGTTLYGFDDQQYAGYFLAEDEYRRFAAMDEGDEREYDLKLSEITAPSWLDRSDQEFTYVGSY